MAEEKLVIQREIWSPSIAAMLQPAAETLDEIKGQVESETAQLFTVNRGAEVLAAFVLRVDRFAFGNDGVIVAAAGRGGDIKLTAAVLPTIETMFQGCSRIRIHTARHGLAKLLAAHFGYKLEELVLTKGIGNGRQD